MKFAIPAKVSYRLHGRGGFSLLQAKKHGYRFDRRADMDEWASTEPQPRDDRLREAVDLLPPSEALILSRIFFGADSPTMTDLSRELGMPVDKLKVRRDSGLQRLRHLLEDDALGTLSADGPRPADWPV